MSDVVAIDVGATSLKSARCDSSGAVRAELRRPALRGSAGVDAVRTLAAELRGPDTVAVGVVTPGRVDSSAGVVRLAVNLDWHEVPLRAVLGDDLGLPVAVGHDVVSAALAEYAAYPRDDMLFVALGTGIAAAHVVGGVARRGASEAAGELGHVVVRPGGEACVCGGRGCLETVASGGAIARLSGADAASVVAHLADDEHAAQLWHDATDALGDALATACALLDPGVVVLGGGMSPAGDALVEPVRARLAAALPWRPTPAVVTATLGAGAGRRGAELLAWQVAREAA